MPQANRDSLAKRLKNLIEASHRLATTESTDDLFTELIRLAKDVVDAEACSLQLFNARENTLDFAWVEDEILGADACRILAESSCLKVGEGVAGWVAANRCSALIEDVSSDDRFWDQVDRSTGFSTHTLLSVPLMHQQELLGVLNALNCRKKPSFDDEDRQILESFANLAATALVRSRLLLEKLRQEKLRAELMAAAQIQDLLKPQPTPLSHDSHFWAWSQAAGFVGGDLCDLIPLTDGSWLVYVADVSGKGLPAALVMTALWSKIRSESSRPEPVDRMLTGINDAMYDMFSEYGYFATIVLARYWPETGQVQFTCGGHIPPYRVANGVLQDVPLVRGISLGVMQGAVFSRQEFLLDAGQSLLFLTDGVSEATNPDRVMFGLAGLKRALAVNHEPPWGQALVNAVQHWCGGTDLDDDLTIAEIYRGVHP